MASAGAETNQADLAVAFRLRAQIGHRARNIAHHLRVRHTALGARLGCDVLRIARPVAMIEMRRNGREAMMRELARGLRDPFIPAGRMMDENHAGEGAFARRLGVIGLDHVALVALHHHAFGGQSSDRCSLLLLGFVSWYWVNYEVTLAPPKRSFQRGMTSRL